MWWDSAFHEFSLSTFAQALPFLFDSENAFEDMDSAGSDFRRDVHDGKPESLHLLVGFDDSGSVRCALGPSYLFEDSFEIPAWKAHEHAFATAVRREPHTFGAGVMLFLLALARGTYALPLAAVRKARRCARDDDELRSSTAPSAAPNGSDISGAADGAPELAYTKFEERLKFAKNTCNIQWHYTDREVSPCA